MAASNTRKSSSVPSCTANGRYQIRWTEVVGIPLFWFKAPNVNSPEQRRFQTSATTIASIPRFGTVRAHMGMTYTVDSTTSQTALSRMDGTPRKLIAHQRISDTIDDDTWSTYSTDDENEKSYLHGYTVDRDRRMDVLIHTSTLVR
jgi:hypothetical protein